MHERLADGEVERVGIAGGNQPRIDSRLERPGVAEVESGQHRGAIQREGGGGDRACREETARAHGLRFKARIWRTWSIGRVFRTCRASTQPRRAISNPSRI